MANTEQRGYHINSGRRTTEQQLPGRGSTHSTGQPAPNSTLTRKSSQNGDFNFTASQPPKHKQSPIPDQNPSYFSNDVTSSNSSCTQSSVSGWAVRPKLRNWTTSAASKTAELPKPSATKPKTQWKNLEVDQSQAFGQQQQQAPTVTVNAWTARQQTFNKMLKQSLNSMQQSTLHGEEIQLQQDVLLAIKLQEEENHLAAAWQRGGRKKQIVNQTSEAFPTLLPPPSAIQGKNTLTSKPQEHAVAQEPAFAFSPQQVETHSLPNVTMLPVNNSSSPSLIQSMIPSVPLEAATENKTLNAPPLNENVELSHDDFEGEVFQSDEDLTSDNEGTEKTQNGCAKGVKSSEEVNTGTSMIFTNRNLPNCQQQFSPSVTPTTSVCTPQAGSEFHNAGLPNEIKMIQQSQESALTTSTAPANSTTPETITIPMQQVPLCPLPPNPNEVLYLAEHMAFVKTKADHAHRLAKEAKEQWGKLETIGFEIEESFSDLQNLNTMRMPLLDQHVKSGVAAVMSSLSAGLAMSKAFVQRYELPTDPAQSNMEPIIMSLPGGGTAVMMRPTSAPGSSQMHPHLASALSLGMTAVSLYKRIRSDWSGKQPVSSIAESNVYHCKEQVEALQRQQLQSQQPQSQQPQSQQPQNLINEACCDALFICDLAIDVIAYSRQHPTP